MRLEHELYADSAQARETDRREEEKFDIDDPWPPLSRAELREQSERLLRDRQRTAAMVKQALTQMSAFWGLEQ
ncbi:hypothetical protein WLF18_01270 [Pseudomonas shirazensis]|uniref:Uncharacterized protein n=1 Tax=Pseudomonas shirazensis TaxID=2745494 RepID=A0ABU8ZVN5_9PSED